MNITGTRARGQEQVTIDRHAMIYSVFKAMDADGSGSIDQEEFMSMFSDKEASAVSRLALLECLPGHA